MVFEPGKVGRWRCRKSRRCDQRNRQQGARNGREIHLRLLGILFAGVAFGR
jgi:hypothetical protein